MIHFTGLDPRPARFVVAPLKLATAARLEVGIWLRDLGVAGAGLAVANVSSISSGTPIQAPEHAMRSPFTIFGILAAGLLGRPAHPLNL